MLAFSLLSFPFTVGDLGLGFLSSVKTLSSSSLKFVVKFLGSFDVFSENQFFCCQMSLVLIFGININVARSEFSFHPYC